MSILGRSSTENESGTPVSTPDAETNANGAVAPEDSLESTGGSFEGSLSEDDIRARLVEKFGMGNFVLNEHEARALAKHFGIEDALGAPFFGEAEESPTAGLTPATGSGGVPYTPEAATEETKKAAKDAQKKLDKAPDQPLNAVEKNNAKRLVDAVADKE